MFKLQFNTANEAFDLPAEEVSRILRLVAKRALGSGLVCDETRAIVDRNGNEVGEWRYTPN